MILSIKNHSAAVAIAISLTLLFFLSACSDTGQTVAQQPQPQPAAAAPQSQSQPATAAQQPRPAATASQPQPAAEAQQPQPATTTSQPQPAATARPARAPAAPLEKVQVVTTTNIVADWVRMVGGDRVDVFSLLPVGADPHSFQPGAQDVVAIAEADLVLSVGLGLEESWLHELVQNAARDESAIVELTDVIDPIEFGATHAGEVEIIEALIHIIHEVEDGEISAEEGLEEIIVAIETAHEHDDHEGHEHEDEDHEGHDHDEDEDEDHEGHDHDEDEDEDHEGHDHDEDEDEDHEGHDHDEDEDEDHEGHDHDEDEDEDHEGHDHDEDEDEDHEGHDHDEEHGDEGMHLPEMVLALIAQVHAGQLDAEAAIEEIHHLAEDEEDAHAGHGHGTYDPHFWFDPLRVKSAINDIAARLSVLDPDGRNVFTSNASAFNSELNELHFWIQGQVSAVEEDRRLLVTSHDSLGYFAILYDFKVVGVILSTTTEVEPTPADLAELSHDIEDYGVPVIFGETTVSERLAKSIADEAGAELVRLYSGSLGEEGSGADTYIGMFRTNVERIVAALK